MDSALLFFSYPEEWDQAYAHFVRGWAGVMKRLERRFNDGPIDWSKERMMYQESKERKPSTQASELRSLTEFS